MAWREVRPGVFEPDEADLEFVKKHQAKQKKRAQRSAQRARKRSRSTSKGGRRGFDFYESMEVDTDVRKKETEDNL